jgi:hypothetical protein
MILRRATLGPNAAITLLLLVVLARSRAALKHNAGRPDSLVLPLVPMVGVLQWGIVQSDSAIRFNALLLEAIQRILEAQAQRRVFENAPGT